MQVHDNAPSKRILSYCVKSHTLVTTVVCILVGMMSDETIHSAEMNDTSYESLWSFQKDEAFF